MSVSIVGCLPQSLSPHTHTTLCRHPAKKVLPDQEHFWIPNRNSSLVLHGFGMGAAGCWMTVIICTIPMFVASCGLASRDCNAVRGRRAPVSNPRGTDTCMPASRTVLVTVRKLQGHWLGAGQRWLPEIDGGQIRQNFFYKSVHQ